VVNQLVGEVRLRVVGLGRFHRRPRRLTPTASLHEIAVVVAVVVTGLTELGIEEHLVDPVGVHLADQVGGSVVRSHGYALLVEIRRSKGSNWGEKTIPRLGFNP
jgi:hypothetical protein